MKFAWIRFVKIGLVLLLFSQLGLWMWWYKLPEKVRAKELTKQVYAAEEHVLKLYQLDWLPPNVKIKNSAKAISFQDTEFSVFADELLVANVLPPGWKIVYLGKYNGQYDYLIQTAAIPDGEHSYDLKFSDAAHNQISRSVHLTAGAKRPDTTGWKDIQYFIDGDSLQALVSKEYRLPEDYAPTDIVSLNDLGIRNSNSARVRRLIAVPLTEMTKAMQAAQIDYVVTSGYRSFLNQYTTYSHWIKYYHGDVAAADAISARPGYSEHQLGTTVDIITGENGYIFDNFDATKLSKWLAENAYKYGFVMSYPADKTTITGYSHEGWHYRYLGIDAATQIHKSGITLIEWLKQYNGVQ